jgi:N-acetylglucosamine kinase-like BadF-type ATPase
MTDSPAAVRIGVDAGGTGTRAVVVRGGEVVDRLTGGPLNVLLHADALDRLAVMIASSGADEAGLGLAGVRSPLEADRIAAELESRTGAAVAVGDDAESALLGAFAGAPGIVVIAGTGSAAYGRSADRSCRVGGHGYLLGDEGGGYWIGNQAVRRALTSLDGTGPAAPGLEALVRKHFGVDETGEVEGIVYAAPTDRAALAGLTVSLAGSDDLAVTEIFHEAATSLASLVTAVRDRLGPLPVAMIGGVWNVGAIRSRFVALTGAVDPLHAPEWGALLLLDQPLPEEIT